MYEHIWFQKKAYPGDTPLPDQLPADWIDMRDVDAVRFSIWREHCLECAAPQCYGSCINWVERLDGRCQKTFYGLHGRHPCGVQLRFRPWGKLEAGIYPKLISTRFLKYLERLVVIYERFLRFLLHFGGSGGILYKFFNSVDFVLIVKLARKLGRPGKTETFLMQCYSPAEKEYRLCVEFLTPDGVFYRNSMEVKNGYNQALFDVGSIDLRTEQWSFMRLYPEDNVQEDLVLLRSDFIHMKGKACSLKEHPAKTVKCVAWDLDNTIWDGTLIERDPDTLALRPGILEIMRQLDERGVLQIAASKNDLSTVMPQLKRLEIADFFVYTAVNWNAKSENLKQAAKALNLGLDTFALIDDSPFERGEVKEHLPCVRVYQETQADALLSFPEFDVPVTEESRRRRAMYQEEGKRRVLQESFTGTEQEFLKSCHLEMTIEPISEETFLRSYELIQRTNQLNLSGRKYTQEAFQTLCTAHSGHSYVVKCRDKYGDYGQVGFFIVEREKDSINVTEYAMSCRVAGKWLEPAMLQWLCAKYQGREVVFSGVRNEKNMLLIRTLQSFGMVDVSPSKDVLRLAAASNNMVWPKIVDVIDRSV